MFKSFIEKKPVGMDAKSIASGLAPPFAGTNILITRTLLFLLKHICCGLSSSLDHSVFLLLREASL